MQDHLKESNEVGTLKQNNHDITRDFTYDILVDGKVEQTTGRNKGMYVDLPTLRRVSNEDFMKTWNRSYQD